MSIVLWVDKFKNNSYSGFLELDNNSIQFIKNQNIDHSQPGGNTLKLRVFIDPTNSTNTKAPYYKGNITIPKTKTVNDLIKFDD
jgi:hypothetical protein